MTDQDVTVLLEDLKLHYGIEVSTITSTRSGFAGQEEIVEITKLVLSGLSGAVLAKIGEDFWTLIKRVASGLFQNKNDSLPRTLSVEIHVSDSGRKTSYEVTTLPDESAARIDAFRRAVTEQITGGECDVGIKYRLSDGGILIPESSDKR